MLIKTTRWTPAACGALALGITEDAAGYGLRMLRTAGLVQTRKNGRVVFYRLADTFPEPLLEHCLRELLRLSELAGEEHRKRQSSRPKSGGARGHLR